MGYSYRDKLLARLLYCQGYSIEQIAQQLGLPRRQTVWEWKERREPDGRDWDEARQEFLRRVREQVERQAADEIAQVTRRQLQTVQLIQAQALMFLRGVTLRTEDGTPVTLPRLEPKSFGEAVRALKDAIMLERLLREQPTQVVRHETRELTGDWTPERRRQFVERLLADVEQAVAEAERRAREGAAAGGHADDPEVGDDGEQG